MRRWAAAAAIVCFLVALWGVVVQWRPFLTTKSDVITATPSLAGLFQRDTIDLRPGSTACIEPVPFNPDAAQVQLLLVAAPGTGTAEVIASAPEYTTATTARGFGTGQDTPVRLPIASPSELKQGRVCVENTGRTPFALVGTAEGRSNAPAQTVLDGKPQAADAALTLFAAERDSILGRFATVLDHASALTGGLLPRPLLWLVAVGLVLGTLVGLPFALFRAVREDNDAVEPPAGGSVRAG